MSRTPRSPQQQAFAAEIARLLRDARKSRHLTQSEVARRTGGIVSKPALANYEAGHRSLRVDVFWLIAKAVGEDPGALITQAERNTGPETSAGLLPLVVDAAVITSSDNPDLARVRRWFDLRSQRREGEVTDRFVTLDAAALRALAQIMGVSPEECRAVLAQAMADRSAPVRGDAAE